MCMCAIQTNDLQYRQLAAIYGDDSTFIGVCDGCEHSGPVAVRRGGSIQCISCCMKGASRSSCCGM